MCCLLRVDDAIVDDLMVVAGGVGVDVGRRRGGERTARMLSFSIELDRKREEKSDRKPLT
jgi:hypothetical protein